MPGPPARAADQLDLHATVAARLRRDQQLYTRGRRKLVDALSAAVRPSTVHDLRHYEPGLALSSAYRNLAVLERAGVVRRIVTSDEHARFELAEDLTGHHHHLICGACGEVEDFTLSPQLERSLEHGLARVASGARFQSDHHRLDIVGTCASCA